MLKTKEGNQLQMDEVAPMSVLRKVGIVWLVAVVMMGFWACGGGGDTNNNNNNQNTNANSNGNTSANENNNSSGKATLRVLHMSYDAPAVDVYVDGTKVIDGLAYGMGSAYAEVEAGSRAIKVTETGKTEALIESTQTLESSKSYTVVAYEAAASIKPIVLGYDRAEDSTKAKIRVIHAAEAPAVDIKVGSGDSEPVFGNLAKGASTEYKSVDAGDYEFVITAAGDKAEVVKFETVKLEAGSIYTVVARGTLDGSDSFDFSVRVFVDNGDGKTFVDLKAAPKAEMKANVRVLHMSYDAPAVDIAVDGAVAISNLAYGDSSGYAKLDAGERAIKVTPTGKDTPVVIDAKATVEANKSYTIVAINDLQNIAPLVLADAREVNAGKAKLRVIHAADAPTVDIKVNTPDSQPVIPALEKGKATEYAELDAGDYSFVITAAGDNKAVVSFEKVTLEAGKVYTVVARGTLDAGDNYDFGVRVFIDNDEGKASVDLKPMAAKPMAKAMVVHASPDAPAVNLFVDGNKVNQTPLAYPNNTGYLDLEAKEHKIEVKADGSDTAAIDATLPFDANKNYTIFAINTLANIEPLRVEDDLTAPASGKAHVRFIHLSPDAPAVDIVVKGGPELFNNQKFKDFTAFTPVDAGTYTIEVKLNGSGTVALTLTDLKLEDGKIYTVFAKGLVAGSGAQALGAEIIVNNP